MASQIKKRSRNKAARVAFLKNTTRGESVRVRLTRNAKTVAEDLANGMPIAEFLGLRLNEALLKKRRHRRQPKSFGIRLDPPVIVDTVQVELALKELFVGLRALRTFYDTAGLTSDEKQALFRTMVEPISVANYCLLRYCGFGMRAGELLRSLPTGTRKFCERALAGDYVSPEFVINSSEGKARLKRT